MVFVSNPRAQNRNKKDYVQKAYLCHKTGKNHRPKTALLDKGLPIHF